MTTRRGSARRLLLTMSSQSASTFANQVVAFVIPWLVLSRTGSALNAGGVAFATGIASVLGTLFGGVIVDRAGGRRTAIIADALSLVTVLALVVALVVDFVPLWLIVVTQVLGCCSTGPGWWPGTPWCPRWPARTTSSWSGRPPSRRLSRTPPCSSGRWPPGC